MFAHNSQPNYNGDEEVKMSKSNGKRGRPRKHPTAPVESHTYVKSKRGRKPKSSIKQYGIGVGDSSKMHFDMTFNESDDNDTAKMYEEIDDSIPNRKYDNEIGPIGSIFGFNAGDNKQIPSNPPQFQSPNSFLSPSRSPAPDFKSKNNVVLINNTNQNSTQEDNLAQK